MKTTRLPPELSNLDPADTARLLMDINRHEAAGVDGQIMVAATAPAIFNGTPFVMVRFGAAGQHTGAFQAAMPPRQALEFAMQIGAVAMELIEGRTAATATETAEIEGGPHG